jgi:hypothetical protein
MDDVQHFDDVLFAFVLGCLSPAETTGIQVHLKTCRRCALALRQVREDTAQLALALPPLPAPTLVREGLLHAIGEINRFHGWAERLATYAGCNLAIAQGWLDVLDDAQAWQDSHDPGVQLLNAPNIGGCFQRLQPGTQVPHDEGTSPSLFVLQGTLYDSTAAPFRPGDVVQLCPDDYAELTVAAGPDLICLSFDRPPKAERPLWTHRPASGARASHTAWPKWRTPGLPR